MLQLAHGRIAHGSQFTQPERKHIPTSYYAESTGIGRLMSIRRNRRGAWESLG